MGGGEDACLCGVPTRLSNQRVGGAWNIRMGTRAGNGERVVRSGALPFWTRCVWSIERVDWETGVGNGGECECEGGGEKVCGDSAAAARPATGAASCSCC